MGPSTTSDRRQLHVLFPGNTQGLNCKIQELSLKPPPEIVSNGFNEGETVYCTPLPAPGRLPSCER